VDRLPFSSDAGTFKRCEAPRIPCKKAFSASSRVPSKLKKRVSGRASFRMEIRLLAQSHSPLGNPVQANRHCVQQFRAINSFLSAIRSLYDHLAFMTHPSWNRHCALIRCALLPVLPQSRFQQQLRTMQSFDVLSPDEICAIFLNCQQKIFC
jgi:hypothetical protein